MCDAGVFEGTLRLEFETEGSIARMLPLVDPPPSQIRGAAQQRPGYRDTALQSS